MISRFRPSRRRGFTLVELIIAVLVIGVLAGIGIFGYTTWRERTWRGVLQSDVKTNMGEWSRRMAARQTPGVLSDSLRLSPGVEVRNEEALNGTYFLAVRHLPTNQTCWGLIDSASAQGTGVPNCGAFPAGYPQVGGGGLPPVASLVAGPQNSAAGATVVLDASGSTDPDGSIVAYSFETGDGTATTASPSAQANYAYWAPDSYTVRVRVTDDDGNTATATQTLVVGLPNESPSQSLLTVSPSQISVGQSATITVTTRNSLGTPLAGRTIALTATGPNSPSLTQPSGPTGVTGVVTGTVTAGSPGLITVGGSVDGQPGLPTATVDVVAAVATTIEVLSGNNQRARANSLAPSPVQVRLRSQTGGVIAGATISWTIQAGGGSVSSATSVTNAQGEATLAGWTLGASGAQTLRASSGAATADISAIVQVPTTLVAVTPTTGTIAFALFPAPLPPADFPRVELRDQDGFPMVGESILWTTAGTGPGTANPTLTGPTTQLTGFDGQATIAGWTGLSSSGATRTGISITATRAGLPPVVFNRTRAIPTQLVWVETATPLLSRDLVLPNAGYFEVRTAANEPVPFAPFQCNSSASWLRVNGMNLAAAAQNVQTNAQGRWLVTSVLSNRFRLPAGTSFQCFATTGSQGWSTPSPVVVPFTNRVPTSIVRVSGRSVPDTILQARGTTVTSGLRYRVLDQFGVPLAGVAVSELKTSNSVRWISAAGFNTNEVSPRAVTDGAGEIALTGAELSTAAGAGPFSLQLNISPTDQVNGGSGDFTLISLAPAAVITPITATSLVVISGNNQRVSSGATLGPIVLEVRNSTGQPLAGFPVNIGLPASSGGGTGMAYTGGSPLTTGADGRVTVTGWRVATVTGSGQQNQSLPASVSTSSPSLCIPGTCSVTLNATIVTAAALIPLDTVLYDQPVPAPGGSGSWTFASLVEAGQSPRSGGIRFRVLDDQGDPVGGVVVRGSAITLAGGCNETRNPAFAAALRAGIRDEVSDPSGLVTFTDWSASPNYTDSNCRTESRVMTIPTCSTTSCQRNLRLERRVAESIAGVTDLGLGQVVTGALVIGQVGVRDQRSQVWAGLTMEWVNTVGPGTITFPGTTVTNGSGIAVGPGWQIIVVPVGTAVQHAMVVRPRNPMGFPEFSLSSISSRVCSNPIGGFQNVGCY